MQFIFVSVFFFLNPETHNNISSRTKIYVRQRLQVITAEAVELYACGYYMPYRLILLIC